MIPYVRALFPAGIFDCPLTPASERELLIRWLAIVMGVGTAVAALYALFATPPAPRSALAPPAVSAPAHETIDEDSRARLEQVLRDAEARQERVR